MYMHIFLHNLYLCIGQGSLAGGGAKDCQFFTKWVPRPEEMTRKKVDDAVIR